jgi:hypothetical protein
MTDKMNPTLTQRRALQIIKLASEQEDEGERLRNAMRWAVGMLRNGDEKDKIIEHLEKAVA